jgi:hypothetical protein
VLGYTKGVPMGSDLGPLPTGKVPTFLVAAPKVGANPERYQIAIKSSRWPSRPRFPRVVEACSV